MVYIFMALHIGNTGREIEHMDEQNNPTEPVTDKTSPVASDKSAALWRLILLGGAALGVILVIGILALQVTEYLFYKAPPDVWPPRRPAAGQGATLPQTWQPGAGGQVSTPVMPTMPSASPSATVAATSAPATAAATP